MKINKIDTYYRILTHDNCAMFQYLCSTQTKENIKTFVNNKVKADNSIKKCTNPEISSFEKIKNNRFKSNKYEFICYYDNGINHNL